MNMTNVLHRRSKSQVADRTSTSTPSSVPPSLHPPETGGRPAPWPIGAKVLVAILLVTTVLGALGMAIAATTTDDGSQERRLEDRIATLLDERDDALADVATIDAELVTLREQLLDAQAGNDELSGQVADLEARIATLSDQRAELDAAVVDLEDQVDVLDAALQVANGRVASVTAERDAFAKLFPLKFDATLGTGSMVGTWDVDLTQVHCSGLSSCGKVPAISKLTISKNAQGWLLAKAPGYVEGGLSRTGGALHMVAHSTTALPQVDGTARQAEVTLTVFPGSYQIASDGSRTVTSVAGVLTVEAPAVGNAPAALAYYTVELS